MVTQIEGRRREILKMIIDDYIHTAEPIGSEAVRGRHHLGVSPATVRNEMAALEEMGLLHQPHTSAGRVPTDMGYRMYVDSLLEAEPLAAAERLRLRRALVDVEPARAIVRAAQAAAAVTDCASVVEAPRPDAQTVRHLHLIPLAPRRALVVVVTDAGAYEGTAIEFDEPTPPEECDRLSHEITRRISGRLLRELTEPVLETLIGEAVEHRRLLLQIGRLLRGDALTPAARIHTEGQANILKQPEFRDARRAQPVLSALERAEVVAELLHDARGDPSVRITIGAEHRRQELQNCSMVAATYRGPGGSAGVLAIVGPTRMRYGRAVALVRFLADALGEALDQL